MKLAFSTLGCPNWDLQEIARARRHYGYDAVELRAIGGDLDLLRRPEFQSGALNTTRRFLDDYGLIICCVDTSCRFDSIDENERHLQVDIAVRHTELASRLGARLIRIFPDTIQSGLSRAETRDNIAGCLRKVAEAGADGVKVALETHGDFARGNTTAEIVRVADHPNVTIIWDVANSIAAGDMIREAAREVAPYLSHVHLRDARRVAGKEHWLPVLAERGDVSFQETVNALTDLRYDGYISFEWEKYWHPEIEEPEVALPDFASAIKKALAGVNAATG